MPKPRQPWLIVLCLSLVVASVGAAGLAQPRLPDVQYVPTPENVVDEMLRLSRVTKDDVVYDLGCGDGRVVITAAKRFGARGVGIDIDPQRIKESQANARKAGVTKRVKFFEQDLFETNIHDATVVALYLLPKLNLDLRPKLLRDLRPGTRVVSHDFDMGEWKPDRTLQLKGPSRQHAVHYWVVPAAVDGTWRMRLSAPTGVQHYELRIQQHFQEIRGSMRVDGDDLPLSYATLMGNRLRFTVTTGGHLTMAFDGRVDGAAMRGRVEVQSGTTAGRYNWTSERAEVGASATPQR